MLVKKCSRYSVRSRKFLESCSLYLRVTMLFRCFLKYPRNKKLTTIHLPWSLYYFVSRGSIKSVWKPWLDVFHHSSFPIFTLRSVASVVTWGRRDLARQLRFKSHLIRSNKSWSFFSWHFVWSIIKYDEENEIRLCGIFEWIHLAQDNICIRWIYEIIENIRSL